MPVLCAFMDNVSLMTTATAASKVVLQRTVVVLKLARMKSRSLVIKGGKCIDEQSFQVEGEIIPTIQKKEPLKTLGRVYNSGVTDWHRTISVIMKAWVYQNLLLAVMRWPLMIYEIPLSRVESVEAYLNGYLRKWLGVSKKHLKCISLL